MGGIDHFRERERERFREDESVILRGVGDEREREEAEASFSAAVFYLCLSSPFRFATKKTKHRSIEITRKNKSACVCDHTIARSNYTGGGGGGGNPKNGFFFSGGEGGRGGGGAGGRVGNRDDEFLSSEGRGKEYCCFFKKENFKTLEEKKMGEKKNRLVVDTLSPFLSLPLSLSLSPFHAAPDFTKRKTLKTKKQ